MELHRGMEKRTLTVSGKVVHQFITLFSSATDKEIRSSGAAKTE